MDQTSLIGKRIEEFFSKQNDDYLSIFRQLSLYIYAIESGIDHDLYMLAKILPKQQLDDLIDFYNGDVIKMPTKKEYKKVMLLTFVYFLKEICNPGEDISWDYVRSIVSFPEKDEKEFSSLSLSRKINKLKDNEGKGKKLKKNLNDEIEKIKDRLNHDLITLIRDLKKSKKIDLDRIVEEMRSYDGK